MNEFKISISKAISSKGIEIELQDFNTKSQWSTRAKLTSPQSNNNTYKDTVFSTDRLSVVNDYEEELSFSYLLKNLLPNLSSAMIIAITNTAEVHYIGKVKDNVLYDGVGLGIVYVSVFFYYFGSGLTESLAIICPKSFGRGNLRLLGIQTNQIRLFVSLYFIVILIINFFFMDQIIYLIAGDVPYTVFTKQYIWGSLPAYFMSLHYDIYSKYSESQLVYKPIFGGLVFSIILHPVLCYCLIENLELGVYGVCIAFNVSEFIKLSMIILYFATSNPYPASNFCIDSRVHENIFSVLKISLMSAMFYYSEIIGWSISNIFATNLGEVQYAKFIALENVFLLNAILSYGFLNTVSIIVGKYVGQNQPLKIRKAIKCLYFMGIILEVPVILLFYFFPYSFLKFFAENDLVYKSDDVPLLVSILILVAVLDLSQNILQGVLRGLNLIKQITLISILIFFVLLPTLCYISIKWLEYGLISIWISMTICMFLLNISLIYYINLVDIEAICNEYEMNFEDSLESEGKSLKLIVRHEI